MSPGKSFNISKFPNTKSKQKAIHQDKEPQMAPESESDAILSQAKTRLPWLVETWLFDAFWRYYSQIQHEGS